MEKVKDKTKKCTRCEIDKPVSEFSLHPNIKDGRQTKCKECTKEVYRDRYKAKRESRNIGVMQPWFIFD